MKIEKLPSGNYRVRMQVDGKRYTMTFPYKPTQIQAYEQIQKKITTPTSKYDAMTFKEASDEYINIKNAVLSPSTIKGYKAIQKALPDSFNRMQLGSIDQPVVQKIINDYSKTHSPKSVRNAHGFISAVVRSFLPSVEFHTTMPQKIIKKPYIPTETDVKRLLEYSKDTEYWVPLSLACLSLRRSEICGASIEDLEGNILHVHRGLVQDENNKFVLKETTKNDASTRDVVLPDELAERIRKQGYIYKLYPNGIDNYLRRTLPKLGIEPFGVHKLRHFFCSYMSHLGMSESSIYAAGGWVQGSDVAKRIYRHEMETDKTRNEMATRIGNLL